MPPSDPRDVLSALLAMALATIAGVYYFQPANDSEPPMTATSISCVMSPMPLDGVTHVTLSCEVK